MSRGHWSLPRPSISLEAGMADAAHRRRMRPSTLALGLIVSALAACGGGLLGTSGAAGTIGTGEGATGGPSTAGWGGTGATGGSIGGTGGELPGCAPGLGRSDFVSFAVTTGAGTAIETRSARP